MNPVREVVKMKFQSILKIQGGRAKRIYKVGNRTGEGLIVFTNLE
jgi:hypothetical protein